MSFLSVITAVLVVLLSLRTASASDWKYVTADYDVRYYYSTSAFEKISSNDFLVSVKEEYKVNENDGIERIILSEEINCYDANYRNKSMSTYYADKTIKTVNFGENEWSTVEYGTNQFEIVTQICSDAKSSKPYLKVRYQ